MFEHYQFSQVLITHQTFEYQPPSKQVKKKKKESISLGHISFSVTIELIDIAYHSVS